MVLRALDVPVDEDLPSVTEEIASAADDSLAALRRGQESVAALLRRAAEFDRRVQGLSLRERELAEREDHVAAEGRALEAELERARAEADRARAALARAQYELDQAMAANKAASAGLARREADLRAERKRMDVVSELLSRREVELEARMLDLDRREARFQSRWRWLLRTWSWRPPLPGRQARMCELLFVPSSDGYKLFEQEAVALRRGSILRGLLAADRTFVVTNVGQSPLDGRWCAYLQQEAAKTEKGGAR